MVAFIFREEVYKKDDPDLDGIAELIIAKQRNGPTDTIKMAFVKALHALRKILAHESDYTG